MRFLFSSVICLILLMPLRAETIFSSNDEKVCEQVYAPYFSNVPNDKFFCFVSDGVPGTTCVGLQSCTQDASGAVSCTTLPVGTIAWNAYPLWADTLLPVGDDRTLGTDMIMHCDIDYAPAPVTP
jgi:hypothetical protein